MVERMDKMNRDRTCRRFGVFFGGQLFTFPVVALVLLSIYDDLTNKKIESLV